MKPDPVKVILTCATTCGILSLLSVGFIFGVSAASIGYEGWSANGDSTPNAISAMMYIGLGLFFVFLILFAVFVLCSAGDDK